jgi:O-antigen/teichoic acid export membrane protein
VNAPPRPSMESTKSGSLTAHVSWLMLAKTLAFAFNLALPLLLVRRLDQTEFGIYKQLFLIIGTAVMVLPLGFGMSSYYFLPREPDRQPATVLNILLYEAAVGGLAYGAFLLWPALLDIIFHQPGLTGYAPAVGLVILLWIASSSLEMIPIANGEMKFASAMIVCVQLSRTSIYLAAVLAFGSVRALIDAAVIQGSVQTIVLLWYLHSRFPGFWRHFDGSLMRRQLSYALPLGFAGLLFTAQTDLHNYFVSNRMGPAMYAIYAVGTVQLPLMGLLMEATNVVLIPRVSVLQQAHDTREIILLLARAMRKLAAVYFPAYAILLVTAREVVSFLFTPRYLASVPVFSINLTLLLLGVFLYDPLFRAYVEQRFFLIRMRVVLCVLLAAGLWFGTTRFGLLGAISTVVLVSLAERVVTAVRFARILGVRRADIVLLRDVGKIAAATAAAGLLAAGLRSMLLGARPLVILLSCGALFGLAYLGALLAAQILTAEEKEIIRRKLAVVRAQLAFW